jgi:phenylalanyl-tRNA synthetase beta chain
MKVSLNWLKDFVDIDVSPEKLAELLNTHSCEVANIKPMVNATGLVVGYVKEMEKHPNADKLNICKVDIGSGDDSQIICGAKNVSPGQFVIVSKPGAVLPGGLKIKSAKLRGVQSDGMICSLSELGIDSKYHNEEGIHVLSTEVTPGDNPVEALQMDDVVFELDLTPNRHDLLSIRGVAYDVAAILDKPVKPIKPTVNETTTENPFKVSIDTDYCDRYLLRVIDDVVIKPSPRFIQSRLIAAGIRPINNVVDITNYVMLETGQPLHAFDASSIPSKNISVRQANSKEKLVTLDGQERTLSVEDIIITDGQHPIALAGVMGGNSTKVQSETTSIALESAVFSPTHIRKTSNRLDLRSDASQRFERGIAPDATLLALDRACELFELYADAKTNKGIAKSELRKQESNNLEVTADLINRNLGSSLTHDELKSLLHRYGFKTMDNANKIMVTIPQRKFDIRSMQDMVEEIGRLIGYDRLPSSLPSLATSGKLSDYQLFKRSLKNILVGIGFSETITYSLTNKERLYDFSDSEKEVSLMMPMSKDRSHLVKTPLVGLIDVISYNLARKQSINIFELSKSYQIDSERDTLGLVMSENLTGSKWNQTSNPLNFYTIKGVAEHILSSLNIKSIHFEKDVRKNCHPGQTASIYSSNNLIGFVAKLHPEYELIHDLDNIYVLELDVQTMFEGSEKISKAIDVSKAPEVTRDLALIVPKDVSAQTVKDIMFNSNSKRLKTIDIFDVYEGQHIETNQKSLAMTLTFSEFDTTLSSDIIEEEIKKVLNALEAHYITLRQ